MKYGYLRVVESESDRRRDALDEFVRQQCIKDSRRRLPRSGVVVAAVALVLVVSVIAIRVF